MISHGAASFLKERLFTCSDPFRIPLCNDCGMVVSKTTECSVCKKDNISKKKDIPRDLLALVTFGLPLTDGCWIQ